MPRSPRSCPLALLREDVQCDPRWRDFLRFGGTDDIAKFNDTIFEQMEEHLSISCIGDLIQRAATEYPDHIALVDERRNDTGDRLTQKQYTYKELFTATNNLSAKLRGEGVTESMRVGVISNNSPDLVFYLLALTNIGATAIPWTERHMEASLTASKAMQAASAMCIYSVGRKATSRLYVESNEEEWIRTLIRSGGIRGIDQEAQEYIDRQDTNPASSTVPLVTEEQFALHPSPNTIATTIFTTGTSSGTPGPVDLSHGNLLYGALISAGMFNQPPGSRVLLKLPLRHVYGLSTLLTSIATGSQIHLCPPEHMQKHGPRIMSEVQPRCFPTIPKGIQTMAGNIASGLREKREQGGIEGFVARCIEDLILLSRRRIAKEHIERLKQCPSHTTANLNAMNEYWKLVLAKYVPASTALRVRAAIGNLFFKGVVARKAGTQYLRDGQGLIICGAGSTPPQDIATLQALGFNVREGTGSTQNTPVSQPTGTHKAPPFPFSEVLPFTHVFNAPHPTHPNTNELVVAGPLVHPQAKGRRATSDKGQVLNIEDKNGTIVQYIMIQGRTDDLFKLPNGKLVNLHAIEVALTGSECTTRAIAVAKEGNVRLCVEPNEQNFLSQYRNECAVLSTGFPDWDKPINRTLLAQSVEQCLQGIAQAGNAHNRMAIVRFPDPDDELCQALCTLKGILQRDLAYQWCEKSFRKELNTAFGDAVE